MTDIPPPPPARAHEPRQFAFGRAQASRRGMAASHAALDTRTAFHPNVARSHFEGRVVPGLFHRFGIFDGRETEPQDSSQAAG